MNRKNLELLSIILGALAITMFFAMISWRMTITSGKKFFFKNSVYKCRKLSDMVAIK